MFEYPIKDRENIMSAALSSCVKRNDVFVSKELVNEHLTSPLTFLDFLFLKECFRKQLKLYRLPSLWCNENESSEYIDFLCGAKKIISCIFQKV